MKKAVLPFIAALTLTTAIFAGIDYEYNDVDKFTGISKFKTKPVEIAKAIKPVKGSVYDAPSFTIEYKDSLNTLSFSFRLKKAKSASLTMVPFNKDNATFLFEDRSKVVLQLSAHKPDMIIDGIKAKITHHFNVPADVVEIFKTKKVTDIRFKASFGGFDYTMTSEGQNALKELCQVLSKDVVPFKLEMPQMVAPPQQ